MANDEPDYYSVTKEVTMPDYFRAVGTGLLYAGSLSIPADTPLITPVSTTITLVAGRIVAITVKFAPGCHDMVGVRIKYGTTQIFPATADTWVYGDSESVKSGYDYPIDTSPYQLTVEGISPGTTYAHKIQVRVEMIT